MIVGNPQAIQEIFTQDSKFDVGCGHHLAAPLIGKNSLMLMDGDQLGRLVSLGTDETPSASGT